MTTLTMNIKAQDIKSTAKFILDSILKFFLGVFLCINPLTAPLVMGWLLRYMRFKTIQVWDRANTKERSFLYWPNWTWMPRNAEDENTEKQGRIRRFVKQYFGAVKEHYKIGILATFNMWIMTLPLCLVWLLMWHAASDMVFNNSHEEIGLIIIASFVSALIFAVLMMYLPMAQARQALNEDWKRFFDFKTIITIARHARIRLFFMAAFYSAISMLIILMTKTFPADFQSSGEVDMNDIKAVKDAVFGHYLMCAFFFFAGMVFLKRMGAKIYAIALLKAVRKGALTEDQLTELEREFLIKKSRDMVEGKPQSKPNISVVKRSLRYAGIFVLILLTIAVWGMFVFTIYMGQFINIHAADWLANPMIHLPYIRIPEI